VKSAKRLQPAGPALLKLNHETTPEHSKAGRKPERKDPSQKTGRVGPAAPLSARMNNSGLDSTNNCSTALQIRGHQSTANFARELEAFKLGTGELGFKLLNTMLCEGECVNPRVAG
jgi:hypothetical protein